MLTGDEQQQLDFVLTFLARMGINNTFPWEILWTDEDHFHMDKTINTQNSRISASETPNVLHEIPLHSSKITVLCNFTPSFNWSFFWGVTVNRPFNKFGYCTKISVHIANFRSSSTAAKTVPSWNIFYVRWSSDPYWTSCRTVLNTTFYRW